MIAAIVEVHLRSLKDLPYSPPNATVTHPDRDGTLRGDRRRRLERRSDNGRLIVKDARDDA